MKQETIWITGASSGIGETLALEYVKQGHIVYGSARSVEKLNMVKAKAQGLSGDFRPLVVDVCDRDPIMAGYTILKEQIGIPHKIILNAGTHKPTSASRFSLQDHRMLMEINYMGVINCLDVILPDLLHRKSGQIAIVSSVAGYRGLPMASGYGASKAALINFCESIKAELEQNGIDLRLVNPGFIKTPLTDLNEFPMPFLMPVEDAVQKLIKGLEGNRFEITFPTKFAIIMKLLRMLPNFIYLPITRKILKG
jgi:short-subunit dehydrogenase